MNPDIPRLGDTHHPHIPRGGRHVLSVSRG
nr:MAG TPA: hypothetical protein [Caudoviricetes sp.]